MLGISFAGIVLCWDEGFEAFLMERKKWRKVLSPDTIAYYRSLFKKYLEGRELSEQLVDYVINHENKWLRNVFRHYIQYLYYLRRILHLNSIHFPSFSPSVPITFYRDTIIHVATFQFFSLDSFTSTGIDLGVIVK